MAIKDKQIERIKKAMDELTQASHKLAEAIYRRASQSRQRSEEKGGAARKDDVIDAEYEEAGPRK